MSERAAPPWFVSAFRADYRRVYPHRDLESARAEVAHLVARGLTGPVLDLCCGFGRHTLALREAGLESFGMDLSQDLLLQASGLPGGAGLRGRLARADARVLPLRGDCFAAVTMLFSSFGYFDDRQNADLLVEVARVLKVGGRAVFDLMNPDRVRATLVPESCREREGFSLVERRRLTQGGRRVVKDVRLENEGGEVHSWTEDVRLYDPVEFDELCSRAGLAVEGREGGFEEVAFEGQSPRQLVWTRLESQAPA